MKRLFITVLILIAPAVTFAQLKVSSDGNVNIQRSTNFSNVSLGIGPQYANIFSSMNVGVHSYMPNLNTLNVGLMGSAEESQASTTGIACGVYGSASNFSNGYNYGVFGLLTGSNNGAAVFGTSNSAYSWGYNTGGKYAGYFCGDVYVTGQIISPYLTSPSDLRIEENVESLTQTKSEGTTLGNLLNLDVISFNYKKPQVKEVIIDEAWKKPEVEEKQDVKRHYGLSVENLQNIYPDLVYEGQDGYLSINYIELVPILIQSIQELKQELDDVKGAGSGTARKAAIATGMADATTIGNVLYQNAPNPFKEQTTIRFHLADDAQNAAICIFDLSGKLLKKLPVSAGMESVSVAGYELGEGMFLYTLMVNGQEIDTKKMVITK